MTRFRNRFEHREQLRQSGETRRLARPIRITAGGLLVITAFLVGWIPGPGFIPLFLAGSFLLASEFRSVAHALDRGESWFRRRLRKQQYSAEDDESE